MFGNMFGGPKAAPTANAPAPAQQTPAPAAAPAPTEPTVPMDQFKDVWAAAPAAAAAPSALDLDVQKVAQSAGQLDFTKVVSPQIMQQISAGGEGANKAFLQAMGSIAQATTAHSQLSTAEIVKQALQEQRTQLLQEFKSQSSQQSAFDGLRAENPMLSHPGVQPIVQAVQAQLQRQNPHATAQELQTMTKEYMTRFAQTVNPPPASKSAKPAMDWSAWASS